MCTYVHFEENAEDICCNARICEVEVAVIFRLLGNEAFETALKNFFFFWVAVLIFSLMIPFLLHIRYPFSSLGRVGVVAQTSRPANERLLQGK